MNSKNKKNSKASDSCRFVFDLFLSWDSLHARLNSHYEAWSYKKKNHKTVKAYRKSI